MDVVVIEFDGRIEDFPVLIQTVDNLIVDGARYIVLDLEPLPFINSAALGYLINAQQAIEGEGGELVLARVMPGLQNILEITELDTIFPAFETIEEAVDYLMTESPRAEAMGEVERSVRRQPWR